MRIYNPYYEFNVYDFKASTRRIDVLINFQFWGEREWSWDSDSVFGSLVKPYYKDFD